MFSSISLSFFALKLQFTTCLQFSGHIGCYLSIGRLWMGSFRKDTQLNLNIKADILLPLESVIKISISPVFTPQSKICSILKFDCVHCSQLIPLGTGSDFARTFGWSVFHYFLCLTEFECLDICCYSFTDISFMFFPLGKMIHMRQLSGLWEVAAPNYLSLVYNKYELLYVSIFFYSLSNFYIQVWSKHLTEKVWSKHLTEKARSKHDR